MNIFAPSVGNVHAVFQADAELAVNGDGRLIAEAHSGLELGLVAFHQVGPLMPVETDAVAGAMRQAGDLVAGPETRIGDDFARGGVDRFAGRARAGGGERGVLRFALDIPDLALALRSACRRRWCW